jgi:hypothetical protein
LKVVSAPHSFFIFCFLSTIKWPVSFFTHQPPWCLPHHGPRINGAKDYGLKSLKLWTKVNCFGQVFWSQLHKSN